MGHSNSPLLAHKDFLLQQYGERIEKLSQHDKLSKFCMDARFLNVVEIGQYFMTKNTADLSQFHAVACRENSSKRRTIITTKRMDPREHQNWPVLEVANSHLHCKNGVGIKF